MFILYALVAGLVVGVATGGRIGALADVRFRWAPLIAIGFLAQIVLFSDVVAQRIGDAGPLLYVASTGLVVAAVVRNLDLPGLPLIVAGAACNLAAILANGGYMPTTEAAAALYGRAAPAAYSNSAIVASPALELLVDRIPLPRWVPFANIISIGDVLLGIGVFVLLVTVMRRGRRATSGPGPAADPA
jgi:Family of unknown function (DUF5317)